MDQFRPLFMTSLARSGSYLTSMMLSVNGKVMIASEPYLDLFRSMRNAFVCANAAPELLARFDPEMPLQDYYFKEDRIRIMDAVQAGDLNTLFDPDEWESLYQKSVARLELQCAELVPYFSEVRGETYEEMFDRAFGIIIKARQVKRYGWVGIKDAWTIEFFGPLARAYPDARFIILLRDPRAIINSMLGVVRKKPLAIAHALSYARHWRKLVAFTVHYQSDPLFSNRLHVLSYEQILQHPEKKARELCDFLEVDFDPAMLDTGNYLDFATGATWKGNSSFEETTSGISVHRATRWRTMLNPKVVKMVDFVCEPDMKLVGYEPAAETTSPWPDPDILDYIIESDQAYSSWRSDLGDPQQDYGFELFRRALLALPDHALDRDLIRRSFLFHSVFTKLRQQA